MRHVPEKTRFIIILSLSDVYSTLIYFNNLYIS